MSKQRKHYSPEEKVSILRRHLVEKAPVSDRWNELKLQPTVFYRWLILAPLSRFSNKGGLNRENGSLKSPTISSPTWWFL
jgi:transposase-like protein